MTTKSIKVFACAALLLVVACGRNAPDVAQENLVVDIFALLSGGKRQVHPVQDQTLPKAIKITTNINEVAPGMPLVITRDFLSEEEPWYCLRYGSGAGTISWRVTDTIQVTDKNGPIIIPLNMEKKTYCGLKIDVVRVIFGADYQTDTFWTNGCEISVYKNRPGRPTLPSVIDLLATKDTLHFKWLGNATELFELPINSVDTFSVYLRLNLEAR